MNYTDSHENVLVVVDVQNDFCPGGALAVPGGHEVVSPINSLARKFARVVLTQDWHPPGHISFASTHPGHQPFEEIRLGYGAQRLWPDHCLHESPGAALHPDLDIPHCSLVVRKGWHIAIDSYSVFVENDRSTPTGLAGYLKEVGVQRVWLAGLATDYCVRYSALDAVRLGFAAFVVEDACRAITRGADYAAAIQEMVQAGVELCRTSEFAGRGQVQSTGRGGTPGEAGRFRH